MKTSILSIIVFLLLQMTSANEHKFDKLKLNLFDESTNSRCLDGTKYGVYFSAGKDEGASNILINFWGGGLCEGYNKEEFFASCLDRIHGELGSSNSWKKEKYESGFLSRQKGENPNFNNWNLFDFPYCDGSFHRGHLENPVNFKGVDF